MDPLPAALVAFLAALAAVPAAAALGRRLGILDRPSARSSHGRAVPRTGGIGVAAALLAGAGGAAALDARAWAGLGPYAAGGAAFLAVGLWDDARSLSPRRKILLQALASAAAVGTGLRWDGGALPPFGALAFGPATALLTWLWLLAATTVVNFVDGIDLITCAVAAVVLAAAAGGGAGPAGGGLYAAAAGATLGLAAWNATPARVFPGDGGTHLLGFLVASAACGVPDATTPVAGLPWALAAAPLLPGVIDVAWGIASKRRRGLPWGAAHNDHLYQRLARACGAHVPVALRYGTLALAGVLVVTRVAPAAGLGAALLLSATVLAAHLGQAARVSRRPGVAAPPGGGPARTIPIP